MLKIKMRQLIVIINTSTLLLLSCLQESRLAMLF